MAGKQRDWKMAKVELGVCGGCPGERLWQLGHDQ